MTPGTDETSARGNRNSTAVQGCYRCRGEDNWINITLNDEEEWRGLCCVMEIPIG